MRALDSLGLRAALPDGFEGRIYQRPAVGGAVARPVAQFATFPIPPTTADFGAGAVTLMGPNDIFVVLLEYGPESVGRALFARRGLPRTLTPGDFRTYTLRRGLGGQSGTQWFFTETGRPFTLYVVLGSHANRQVLVPRCNELLAGLAVSPPPAALSALAAANAPTGPPS